MAFPFLTTNKGRSSNNHETIFAPLVSYITRFFSTLFIINLVMLFSGNAVWTRILLFKWLTNKDVLHKPGD